MLVTKQKLFRRFWFPVIPIALLQDGPKPFTLLEEKLVIWLDKNKQPVAMADRCCHRSAQLSRGKIVEGHIQCAYHGWRYDNHGQCIHIPQLPNNIPPTTHKVTAYQAKERYGYVWVCLENPLMDIPPMDEAFDPAFRLIPEFYETWQCAGLRVMENELDLAHPAFVHRGTFGSNEHLIPSESRIEEFEHGLHLYAKLGVINPELQQRNLKMQESNTTRILKMSWYLPFTCKLDIQYTNGLHHIVVNTMTPITDFSSQMVQFCLRSDTEKDSPHSDVIKFDRAVTLEDKAILESTDYDVPLDTSLEKHLFTDKPGILMRKQILNLLHAHGEEEVMKNTLPGS